MLSVEDAIALPAGTALAAHFLVSAIIPVAPEARKRCQPPLIIDCY